MATDSKISKEDLKNQLALGEWAAKVSEIIFSDDGIKNDVYSMNFNRRDGHARFEITLYANARGDPIFVILRLGEDEGIATGKAGIEHTFISTCTDSINDALEKAIKDNIDAMLEEGDLSDEDEN